MKSFATILAVLASVSISSAGLMPKSDNIAMMIGCYPTGNNPGPNAMEYDLATCDGQLNGDNCLRFCKCNDKSEVVCDSSSMKGCSDKEMSDACFGATLGNPNGHWYCSCWPAKN